MVARYKRLGPHVAVPAYQTAGAAGFDLAAAEAKLIAPEGCELVATGLVIASPPDHFLAITPRSSLYLKKGLILANSPGVVDEDYCGDKDEIKLVLWNPNIGQSVHIEKGERLANGVFIACARPFLVETQSMGDSRGGFGSTGGMNVDHN